MSHPTLDHDDIEKAAPIPKIDKRLKCRPTISAIDIHFGGHTQRAERYPRSLRKNEAEYVASLPPLAPKSTRIYLREEDCSASDAFAVQGTNVLEFCKQQFQFGLRLFPATTNLSPELFECAIARFLEKSGADRWDSVHKVDRFDIWDLRNLFDDQQYDSQGFLVQLNVEASQMHQRAIPAAFGDLDSTRRKLYAGRFGGDTVFWEKYAALKICKSKVEDAFEVHCLFPALSYAALPQTLADEHVFPLLIQFEQLLCSDDTSVPSNTSDPAVVQTYIVLDYLRCVTLSWQSFLKRVGHVSRPGALLQSQHDNDIHVTTSFQNAVNDLQSCVSYVLDRGAVLNDSALTRQPVVEEPSENSSRKHLLLAQDLRAQTEYLSRKSNSLLGRSQRLFEADSAATSNSQAQSAGRLTVVASIFLPLTLAASLLAMNVPAASIGRLWYDFTGMVICIGFICFSSYRVFGGLQRQKQNSSSVIGALHRFDTGTETATKTESGRTSDAIFTLLLWGFPAVIAASFLAGMFSSFDFALDALKFGLPILFAIFVVYLAFQSARNLPPTRDCYRTLQYVDKIVDKISENEKGDSSGSSTLVKPSLSDSAYNKDLKALLEAIVKAFQTIETDRPANPRESMVGESMVGLVHQFCEEAKNISELDGLCDGSESKTTDSH